MYGTGGLFVRCGSALVLVLLLILVLVLLGIAVLTGVLVLVALVAVLILVLVLILVHDGHLLYLRYRDSVTGIGENMHGSAHKNANGGAGVVPEGGIWYNAGIIF